MNCIDNVVLKQELDGVKFYVDGIHVAFIAPFKIDQVDIYKVSQWASDWLIPNVNFREKSYCAVRLLPDEFLKKEK